MQSFGSAVRLSVTLICVAAASRGLAQLYDSSVVGTTFDFIRSDDPDAFLCLEFKGKGFREMPDKRGGAPLVQAAFIFVAYFEDGTSVDIAIDDAFETEEQARKEALRYTPRLGKLPTALRRGVKRLVVHEGGRDTTAFSDVGLIVVYSANATKRIDTHDLEETIFHESVHAAWDADHANGKRWLAAQEEDGAFVTRYAAKHPRGEDLAESALFAFTLVHHEGRIPPADARAIREAIPARIAYIAKLLPPGKPLTFSVGPRYACDGSGKTFTVDAPTQDEPNDDANARPETCTVNIKRAGGMSDIVSNALMLGLGKDEPAVRAFLKNADRNYPNGEALLVAAAKHFDVPTATLRKQVQAYLHCNCKHR